MSRLADLQAISRLRHLTEKEVEALIRLSRPTPPSRAPEAQRRKYEACKDEINARHRARYANDPEYRARRLAYAKWRYHRKKREKAKQCSA